MKRLAMILARASGANRLARAIFARRGRFVLELHGVARERLPRKPHEAQPSLCRSELDEILGWAGRRFRFLSPEAFCKGDEGGILLTFDDGFRNHHENVLPLLRRHDAPAVFFVTTQHVVDPRDWLPATRRTAAALGDVSSETSSDLFDGMSIDALRDCAADPLVTIGSHTESHPLLTKLDDDALRVELVRSRAFLEDVTGVTVDLFAYPTGDYDRRVVEAVRAAGYRAAFVEESPRLDLGRFEIPRIGIYSARAAYLSTKLNGLYRTTDDR